MSNLLSIKIPENQVIQAASEGMDAFIRLFTDAYWNAIGGDLNAQTMACLNADQLTLLGFSILHEEVMDGGFIQLIHNGYGPFIFENPFAKAMRLMGAHDFSKLLYKVRPLYMEKKDVLTCDCSEEEFMALFEQHPEFDDLDDAFIESEEEIVELLAHYVDEHIERFAEIVKD